MPPGFSNRTGAGTYGGGAGGTGIVIAALEVGGALEIGGGGGGFDSGVSGPHAITREQSATAEIDRAFTPPFIADAW
jgi:hypothetical protein